MSDEGRLGARGEGPAPGVVERGYARCVRRQTHRGAVGGGPVGAARRIEIALVNHGCCCDRSCETRDGRSSTAGRASPPRHADDLIFRSLSLQFSRHASQLIQNYKTFRRVTNGLRMIILSVECNRPWKIEIAEKVLLIIMIHIHVIPQSLGNAQFQNN